MSEKGLTWIRTLKCKELIKKERNRMIQDVLDDLKEFELKRYSDMIRTLTKLREKLEGKLNDT